jgi:hypothetical protein
MKIAFFSAKAHPIDLKRHILLAKACGYEICEDLFIKLMQKKNKRFDLMLADSCGIKTLFKVCIWDLRGHFSKVSFIALELFNFSFRAWFYELIFVVKSAKTVSNLSAIIYFAAITPIRIFLIRIMLLKKNRQLIVPSELRIDFLKNILPKSINYLLIRNKPILSELNFNIPKDFFKLDRQAKATIKDGYFLFIAGRINVEEQFYNICKYADESGLKIIVATGQVELLNRSIQHFPKLIFNLGNISNSLAMYISTRCLAGVCLYHNFTINQRLSASSKFFEFMIMNKPVITSDNPGVKGEVNPVIQHLIISAENLDVNIKINREELKLNKEFSFENEIKSVSINNSIK